MATSTREGSRRHDRQCVDICDHHFLDIERRRAFGLIWVCSRLPAAVVAEISVKCFIVFKQFAVRPFPAGVSLMDRLEVMRSFMKKNFPQVHVKAVRVIHKRDDKDGARYMTGVGLIDVGDSDTRKHVANLITSNGYKLEIAWTKLDVKKARSLAAGDRNQALKDAAYLVKKLPNVDEKAVDIKWTGQRGVTIGEGYAFTQPPGNELGSFDGEFSDLKLP